MRERNSKIVRKKKDTVVASNGKLVCEVCGFDFQAKYGELGEGFAECHHEVPVSELKPGQRTKMEELRIVCSNCHRMIHRKKPWKSIADLQRLVQN